MPDSNHICESGQVLLVYPDGAKSCESPAPRSQADCPPKTTFRVIAHGGACTLNLDNPGYIPYVHYGEPPAIHCEHDSDCQSGFCGSGFCGPGFPN